MEKKYYCKKCEEFVENRFCSNCGSLTSQEPPKERPNLSGTSSEIIKTIFEELSEGDKIPKIKKGNREVIKIENNKIYMMTGVATQNKKYITKDMIKYALDRINLGKKLDSTELKREFRQEFKQGECVFSMTGGLLEFFDLAMKRKKDNKYVYLKKDTN